MNYRKLRLNLVRWSLFIIFASMIQELPIHEDRWAYIFDEPLVDYICKVANNYDPEGLGAFLLKLDTFLKDTPVVATILYSGDVDSLPEEARKFA